MEVLHSQRQPNHESVEKCRDGNTVMKRSLSTLFRPHPEVIQSSLENNSALLYDTKQGFVGILSAAYNQHHALILRPDDVWQALVIQFSFYVQARAEALRDRLVDFQGKKELEVEVDGKLYSVDYGALSRMMVDQIRQNIRDPSIADWLLPSFSTTTTNDLVVASVSMMSTLKAYFDYKFTLCCGIPSVELLGSVEDWERLLEKIERFAEFDLSEEIPALPKRDTQESIWEELAERVKHLAVSTGANEAPPAAEPPVAAPTTVIQAWLASLRPILSGMLATRKGEDNMLRFWDHVLTNSGGGSGPRYISGWIRAFCAFTEQGVYQGHHQRIDTNNITTGMLSVPVLVNDNGAEYKCTLVAGQLCADVVRADGAGLQPRSDWMIVNAQQAPSTSKYFPGFSDDDEDEW